MAQKSTNRATLVLAELIEKIEYWRRQRGFSQTTLAQAVGISRQTMLRIENGQSALDVELLLKISHTLEVPVCSLLYGSQNCGYIKDSMQRIEAEIASIRSQFKLQEER